jgi:ferric-dicitrate binding protein FerR (iron transport regulator)
MSMNDLNDSTLSRLGNAANWLQRLHQSPDDDSLFEKCRRWLDADPENVKAFERMQTVWQAIGELAIVSQEASESRYRTANSPQRRLIAAPGASMPPAGASVHSVCVRAQCGTFD